MKKNVLRFGAAVGMVCVMFTACKKADVVASATDPQLTFALVPDNPIVSFPAKTAGTNVTVNAVTVKQTFWWTGGTANITRFRLNAKRGGVASEYSSGNLTGVDLFSQISSSSSTISIPKGDFTEVKTAVMFSPVIAAPYPMVLQGTFTNSAGIAVPVEFDLNDEVAVNVSVSNIIADGSKDFTASIAMHLNLFMTGITPDNMEAATKTSGTILITKTSNLTLYNKIKANMVGCSGASLTNRPK